MGVDCNIILNDRSRIRDVADVMGALAGLKPERCAIAGSSGVFVRVPGVEVKGNPTIPEMATITLKGPMVDKETDHFCNYHFEADLDMAGRLLAPRSTPFWLCVGRGLVDFFGGYIVYNDCGDMEPDYQSEGRKDVSIRATNGREWDDLQLAKLDLKPITKEQLDDARQWAAYK